MAPTFIRVDDRGRRIYRCPGRIPSVDCGNAVALSQNPAKTGDYIGLYFIHCGACHLHYRFTETPEGVHRTNPDVDISTMTKAGTQSPKCRRKPCTKNAHGLCKKECCRFCCVVLGGCSAKDHNLASLSIARQKKALNQRSSIPGQLYSAQPPTPSSSRISPTPTFDALAKVLRDQDPVIQFQHEDLLRVQAEQRQADQELAQELQEEEEHQAMLASARAALRSPPIHSSPTFLPPQSSSRTLQLIPLSTLAPENHGDDSTTFFVAGLPVTRVGSSNQPKKTTQMNETWMREYEDHTKEVQKRKGKGQIDLEMVQKFRVVWWEQTGVEPTVFTVQDCPHWPKWKINDSPPTLKRLGDNLLQFYDTDHNIWVESNPSYPHTLQTDRYLLLHGAGVVCQNFEQHLAAALHKPTNQRTYMTKIRQSIKSKTLKGKGKARARSQTDDESDESIEFVDIPSICKVKLEPGLEEPPAKRLRLMPLFIPSTIGTSSHNAIVVPDSPTPTMTSSIESTLSIFPSSALSSRSSTPPPFSPTLSPLDGHSVSIPGKSWPGNMYVEDMVKGFVRMDALKKTSQGRFDERFQEVYGQDPPKANTYHDQVRKWNLAPSTTRNTALAAGRTRDGEWSRFARSSPLKKNL